MTTTAARATTYAWIVLSAITIVPWWLAPGHTRGAAAVASVPITVAVIQLAFVKGRLIIRHFMEVRTAPGGSNCLGECLSGGQLLRQFPCGLCHAAIAL